jgi:hypothetical protein
MVAAHRAAPSHTKLRETLEATLSYAGWNKDFEVASTAEGAAGGWEADVSRAFPSWTRPAWTEIDLCDACASQEMEGANASAGWWRWRWRSR